MSAQPTILTGTAAHNAYADAESLFFIGRYVGVTLHNQFGGRGSVIGVFSPATGAMAVFEPGLMVELAKAAGIDDVAQDVPS